MKPNVGHSEGASGITSLIKTVLALEHKTIPPNINFNEPNPKSPSLFNTLPIYHLTYKYSPFRESTALRAHRSYRMAGEPREGLRELVWDRRRQCTCESTTGTLAHLLTKPGRTGLGGFFWYGAL